MIKELIKLSNHLDAKGLRKEADYIDSIIKISFEKDVLELASELSEFFATNYANKSHDLQKVQDEFCKNYKDKPKLSEGVNAAKGFAVLDAGLKSFIESVASKQCA
mgnify:CR=1 FL=1|tara:strand:+ start:176 stop:493 length:318 start_codon:yes stop_codon:yes gene_type:complete